jgi:hypothetical protein
MELQRLAGQGRLSEALKSSDETIAIDTYFRSLKYVLLMLEHVGRDCLLP